MAEISAALPEVVARGGKHDVYGDPEPERLLQHHQVRDLADLERWHGEIAGADAVMVGSYVPDGVAVGRFVQETART